MVYFAIKRVKTGVVINDQQNIGIRRDNGCPLIIETEFDIAFKRFIAVGSS